MKYGAEAYPGVNRQVYYKEDVFVGYRGFEKDKTAALFPFGFGLSYTTFSIQDSRFKVQGDSIFVTVTVTNTGSVAGKEVVQVYVSAPKNAQIEKPVKELKTFAKTKLLQPGEKQTLTMTIAKADLASWNEALHQWQTDNGDYTIQVGRNSRDIVKKEKVTL